MPSQRRNDWCDADSAQELFDRHPDLLRHPDSPGELQEDGTIVGGCPNWQDPKSVRVPLNNPRPHFFCAAPLEASNLR